MSGYLPKMWMEARTQLHSTQAIMGSLIGVENHVVLSYGQFLRQYEHLITCLESEIEQVHGRQLGRSLVTFHAQLVWRNWIVTQLDT
jgi:hypothetical protein